MCIVSYSFPVSLLLGISVEMMTCVRVKRAAHVWQLLSNTAPPSSCSTGPVSVFLPPWMGSAAPTEGACVIHTPLLHCMGRTELLMNRDSFCSKAAASFSSDDANVQGRALQYIRVPPTAAGLPLGFLPC